MWIDYDPKSILKFLVFWDAEPHTRSDWIFWLKIQARRDDETFLTQPEKAVASIATVANSRLRRPRRLTIFITVISPTGKSGRGPGGSRESNGVARQGNREYAGTRP